MEAPPVSQFQWLSFCDGSRPKGSQFLGCAIVPGANIVDAASAAWALECNPGGEVAGHAIPERLIRMTPPSYVGRLLTRTEAEVLDRMWLEHVAGAD
jgi:hypothetical protein